MQAAWAVAQMIMFDPAYDEYHGMCERAGGKPRAVPLDPETWAVQRPALAAAFSPRTKLLLLNSPHNPTGAWRQLRMRPGAPQGMHI